MDSVRLTCATKPHVGEKWLLKRTRKGLLLLDEEENKILLIPAGEANLRIHLPSFWASRYLVIDAEDEPLLFEPNQKAMAKVRALIEDCADTDPEATAAAYWKKAIRDLLIGGGSFLLGMIITCASFFIAAPDEKFYVMTGLLLVGLVEIIRGIYYAIKSNQYSRMMATDEEEAEEDE